MKVRPRRRLSARAWDHRCRVREVARLFRAGLTRAEIALKLNLSGPLEAGQLVRDAATLRLIPSAGVVAIKPPPRSCMACGARFEPSHRFHRLCDGCRQHASALPASWA